MSYLKLHKELNEGAFWGDALCYSYTQLPGDGADAEV